MLKEKVYPVSLLLLVTFFITSSAGCGIQSHVSTGATVAQSTTAIPLDLDSPAVVAQVIANDPTVLAVKDRIDTQALDTPALVFYLSGHGGPVFSELDHWVVTTRDASGRRVGVFDFHYVRSQRVLRGGSAGVIMPGTHTRPAHFPGWPPRLPSSGSTSCVASLPQRAAHPA